MLMSKCPFCGMFTFGKVPHPSGTSFVLTCVDTNQEPPMFQAASGMAVNVLGCTSCKKSILEIPSLVFNPNK